MRLTVILTLTLKEGDNELVVIGKTQEYMEYAEKQYKGLGYTILKASVGIHKDATRLHSHMTHVLEVPPEKIVKHFDKVLQKQLLNTDDRFELRRTLWKDNNPQYDEKRGLGYNLKEYETWEQVIMLPSFKGLSNEEIEELRNYAHDEWMKSKAEKERNAKRKQLEEDEGENIAQYIRDFISPNNRKVITEYYRFDCVDFTQKLTLVKVAILHYYEDRFKETGKRKFKAYSVRDMAVSFLTVENLVSKLDMAKYL